MSTPVPTNRENTPVVSTTPMARVDMARHLSPRTVAWLAGHPDVHQFVCAVWDKLAELDRAGQYPGAIAALRRILTCHQPTSAGRCRTCARVAWRRRPFPCIVWHQVRCDLLGLSAGSQSGTPSGPQLSCDAPD